jgi:exonuclease SbcC
VLQAEALAAASVGEADARIVKLSIKQQAEVIDDLHARWKELDRLGGATNRSLWQRFDAALKTAYQPVAAHFEAQRAARQQNLIARDQLVEALNAVTLPEVSEGAAVPDWKSLAAALDQFQTEWRKLGPLEHTVPHKDRGKLVERMSAAVQRLEAPLTEARRVARLARERLIAGAKALASEAGAGAQGRDVVGKVRELQAEWQQQAKALPLTRAVENALWAEFKTHIDAVFSEREAVFSARDAEFKSNSAERAALIDRLVAMTADTPPAELKRTLAEVDAQWQRTGPASRSDAAALDSRFNNAREAVRQYLACAAQRHWHTNCDALEAKLAMCEELERSATPAETRAAIEQRWKALPALQPAAWEQALAERASLVDAAQSGNSRTPASTGDLLMQLEVAFQLDSPPEFQAARREMKLQAMKAALEGRQSLESTPLAPDELLAAALGRTPLDGPQRERLGKVIAAVRSLARPGAG